MIERYPVMAYKGIETAKVSNAREEIRLVHIPKGTDKLEFRILVDEIISKGERIVGASY